MHLEETEIEATNTIEESEELKAFRKQYFIDMNKLDAQLEVLSHYDDNFHSVVGPFKPVSLFLTMEKWWP